MKADQILLAALTGIRSEVQFAQNGDGNPELIAARADSSQPNMGLTTWEGARIRKADVSIAKNYLKAEELEGLNRIVTAYLEFAELRAMNRQPMYTLQLHKLFSGTH